MLLVVVMLLMMEINVEMVGMPHKMIFIQVTFNLNNFLIKKRN